VVGEAPGPAWPKIVWGVLLLASCTHVFIESARNRRIGHPVLHALMCAIVLWPLPYLLWLFWWPGALRQKLFGSDRERAARRIQAQKRSSATPTG
jgi:tellurite resistance protein TehA-like permease